jgi:hypothetical protein
MSAEAISAGNNEPYWTGRRVAGLAGAAGVILVSVWSCGEKYQSPTNDIWRRRSAPSLQQYQPGSQAPTPTVEVSPALSAIALPPLTAETAHTSVVVQPAAAV